MSEFLAEASVLIRPDTTKFRSELQAELTALTKKPVVVPVALAPVGGAAAASATALAGANTEVATTAKAAAAAEVQQAKGAQAAAAANRAAAKAAAEHAAAQSQLARGAAATGLSLLGARGATLAAGSEFLAGAAAVTIFAKAIQGASEDEEAAGAATRLLGKSLAEDLGRQADILAPKLGLIDDEIVRFQSTLGQIFGSVGVASSQIGIFADQLTRRAADIAAIKDIGVEDVFKAIQSALLGNLRGLRQLGIGLTAVAVNERALADTGKETAASLTEQERVLARLELTLERTSRFAGGFRAEAGRLAGQSRILRSNIEELGDTIGAVFLPTITEAVGGLNTLAAGFFTLKQKVSDFIPVGSKAGEVLGTLAQVATGPIAPFIALNHALNDTSFTAIATKQAIQGIRDVMQPVIAAFLSMKGAVDSSKDSLTAWNTEAGIAAGVTGPNLANAVDAVTTKITAASIAGAGPAGQVSGLQQRIQANQDLIKQLNAQINAGLGDVQAALDARQAALSQILADQQEIKSIEDQQAAAVQDSADAAQRAADDAKAAAETARKAHDQRIQDRIDAQQNQAEIKLINAEATKGLEDDIKAQIAIRNLIQRQIRVLVPQVKDVQLRTQVLQALTLAEAQSKAAVQALFKERNDNREAAKEAARQARLDAAEAKVESADLSIQLAQINDNTKKEIAAHQLKIKRLIELRKLFKKGTNEYKRLTVEIAAEQKAIDDLKGQAKKTGGAARDFFEFLQKQQGFAVSLLGNLFPGGAASGALGVGATRGAGAAASDLFPQGAGPTGVGDVTGALAARAQIQAGAPRGTTQGQTQTVIEILRQILRVLQVQGRATADPEARFNRASGSAVMDIM